MKNAKKALQAIEYLTGDDFAADLEWVILNERKQIKDPWEYLKHAAEIFGKIYMIAHSENSKCKHPDWEDEKYKVIKGYKGL